MFLYIDDLCICIIELLILFVQLLVMLFCDDEVFDIVSVLCVVLYQILYGCDDCLVVVVGLCLIYDLKVVIEYVQCLKLLCDVLVGELEIVMCVYFEKLCIMVGWKGLINDLDLDGSFRIDKGLCIVCGLLCDINKFGLLVGVEFFDVILLQYIVDLVVWGVIGVCIIESQVYCELVLGLLCLVGFKNGIDGNVKIVVDVVGVVFNLYYFLLVIKQGGIVIVLIIGNLDCYVILCGGK